MKKEKKEPIFPAEISLYQKEKNGKMEIESNVSSAQTMAMYIHGLSNLILTVETHQGESFSDEQLDNIFDMARENLVEKRKLPKENFTSSVH